MAPRLHPLVSSLILVGSLAGTLWMSAVELSTPVRRLDSLPALEAGDRLAPHVPAATLPGSQALAPAHAAPRYQDLFNASESFSDGVLTDPVPPPDPWDLPLPPLDPWPDVHAPGAGTGRRPAAPQPPASSRRASHHLS